MVTWFQKTKKLQKLLIVTLAQLLITLICIIGKTKFILHQAILMKLMTLSRIMKNIQTFVIQKQNIEILVNSNFDQFLLKKSKKIIQDLKTSKAVGGEIQTKILK